MNQGFIAIKPNPGISNLFLLRSAADLQDEIINRANGTTFLEISKQNFRPIPVLVHKPDVMTVFDNSEGLFYTKIVANERESQTLAALDALLPKLVSRDVTIH